MRRSCGMSSPASISLACRSVGQSDWLPMISPTSGGAPATSAMSGDAVRDEPALQPRDLVLEHQLAFLEPLDLELVERPLIRQPRDDRIEITMLAAQFVQL